VPVAGVEISLPGRHHHRRVDFEHSLNAAVNMNPVGKTPATMMPSTIGLGAPSVPNAP
jgi:hypothetical protein